ncbi:ABC transporter permease [Methanomassiliicoccus luminyensis]|jgi:ABC-type transport system involved in multi-copper enzyme maturation permease subunit|uniref:ABC transporter permease n=1 Tax=Methanomassiliicoccus luminyensis TaxID=1080712 RepID=UPI00036B16C4|nr:ABC transporter permease [Methanomassiliicoccus luminyensis]
MSEFSTHLRKDAKLLTTDSLFVVLLVLLAIISFIIALTTSTSYVWSQTRGSSVITQAIMEENQKTALISYWISIGTILMALFSAVAAMAMSVEKDSGMSKYILTFKVRKPLFYLSKLLVLTVLVLAAMGISLAAYLIVFSFMDVPMLDIGSLAASMLFPMLGMLVFASLGLALSTLTSKKGAVIALAVVLFLAMTSISSVSMSLGVNAALDVNPEAGPNNYTAYMPWGYKLLIYGNPVILAQGTSYALGVDTGSSYSLILFDTAGGVALGLGFFVAFVVLGMLSFSRERTERGLIYSMRDRFSRLKRT